MDELKAMMNEIVIAVLNDNSNRRIVIEEEKKNTSKKESKPRAPRIKSIDEIMCPKCGQGHLIKGRTAYGCSRFREGCDLILPFNQYPENLTPAKLRSSISKKK